jgi:hypothetical protein
MLKLRSDYQVTVRACKQESSSRFQCTCVSCKLADADTKRDHEDTSKMFTLLHETQKHGLVPASTFQPRYHIIVLKIELILARSTPRRIRHAAPFDRGFTKNLM